MVLQWVDLAIVAVAVAVATVLYWRGRRARDLLANMPTPPPSRSAFPIIGHVIVLFFRLSIFPSLSLFLPPPKQRNSFSFSTYSMGGSWASTGDVEGRSLGSDEGLD